jgi:hypothetical protein
MRDVTGSATAPAARCRNCLRRSFMVPSLRRYRNISTAVGLAGSVTLSMTVWGWSRFTNRSLIRHGSVIFSPSMC